MYVANEGKLVAFVAPEAADAALAALRAVAGLRAGGRDRRGHGTSPPGMVLVETAFGGRRVMDQLWATRCRGSAEEGGRMHRTKVRVVEDALDANDTIARANRDDFDRHDVTVVNLMSAPGAGKTSLLERALAELAATVPDRGARGRRAGLLRRRPAGGLTSRSRR